MNTIPDLQRLYTQLTGFHLSTSYMREYAWSEFLRRGHTEAELVKTVTWLRGEIRKGNRNPGALRFSNLIEDCDRFEEELAMSGMRDRQFKERAKVSVGKREVLAATGRDAGDGAVPSSPPARPVAELIAELRKAAGMTV